MGVLKQTLNSLHVAINMAGPSKKSSKKKSKTALLGRRDSAALPLDDDEKAEKAADKERKNQANIKRNAKLAQILARKLDPNAVSPETTAEIPKEVAEKLKIKALKKEQAKQEAEQLELAKKEAEVRNQEFIRKTKEAEAERRARADDEQEARKKAREEAIKNFDKLPFFEKLGLADEMVLKKIKKYVIIQILLLVISVLHVRLYIEIINRKECMKETGLPCSGVPSFLLLFSSFLFKMTSFDILPLVEKLPPTYIGALFLVVLLVLIFKFYKFVTSDYKNDWIEQETRRIHDQSCA